MDREVVEQKLAADFDLQDIAVQSYDAINWNIVHSIARNHLADFTAFAKVAAMKLDN